MDIGVDVGVVKKSTSLFREPSRNSTAISTLHAGARTVLVSRIAVGGWLNVIQSSTGHQGWVLADRLALRYTRHRRPANLVFQREDLGTIDAPVVEISNSSEKTVYVHIDGQPEIAVAPYGQQTASVSSGIYQYNATAADVIPDFGVTDFINGSRYTWRFFITSAGAGHARRKIDPALIAENRQLQAQVDQLTLSQRAAKNRMDADRADLSAKEQQLQRDTDEVDRLRPTLDNTDAAAVDRFNQLVDSANAESAAVEAARTAFNQEVDLYNANLDLLNRLSDRLSQIEKSINGGR